MRRPSEVLTPELRADIKAIALSEIMDAAREVTDDGQFGEMDPQALIDAAVALQAVIDLPEGHPALVSIRAVRGKLLPPIEDAVRGTAWRHAASFAGWVEHRGYEAEVERAWRVLRALAWDTAESRQP